MPEKAPQFFYVPFQKSNQKKLKIALKDVYELSEEDNFIDKNSYQKFKSRKRNLSGKKDINDLVSEENNEAPFTSSDLCSLNGDGIIEELVSIIKTGKEASVYLGKCKDEFRAVKIYTDIRVRSFRNDVMYREGRYVGRARIKKAIDQGSETGLNAHQLLWVSEEFRQMRKLHSAGISVPEPIALSGLTIVMEFIGSEDGEPAPRLSDVGLEKPDAEEAFRQSLSILKEIVSMKKIHGDYSAFNLLWHEEKVIVIDFPQVIEIENNPSYKDLLLRDVVSLCKSFRRHGINADPQKIFRRMLSSV